MPIAHRAELRFALGVVFLYLTIAMALEKDKIEEALKKLPTELHDEVLNFVESLLENRVRDGHVAGNGTPSVRSLFGSWDSGDPRSADNARMDADLAREYGDSHEADS